MQLPSSISAFKQFSDRYNKSEISKPANQTEIYKLELEFDIYLPYDFKLFATTVGNIWTPHILNIIVDNEIEMEDVQQFWKINEIINYKNKGWLKPALMDLLPFASDCGGNVFAFLTSDLETENKTASVYFWDYDFESLEKISSSFSEWIEKFTKM